MLADVLYVTSHIFDLVTSDIFTCIINLDVPDLHSSLAVDFMHKYVLLLCFMFAKVSSAQCQRHQNYISNSFVSFCIITLIAPVYPIIPTVVAKRNFSRILNFREISL